jgi:hypothetical protein
MGIGFSWQSSLRLFGKCATMGTGIPRLYQGDTNHKE